MRVITPKIILQIACVLLFLAHLSSSQLEDGNSSDCGLRINRTKSREISYREYYLKLVWHFIPWVSYRIKSESKNFTEVMGEQKCCDDYKNVSNKCQLNNSSPMACGSNCENPPSCDCKNNPETRYTKRDTGYKNDSEIPRCRPLCSSECKNGCCKGPYLCYCVPPNFRPQNSTECVPLCKKPCKNGKCVGINTCECDEGWAGSSCGSASLCRINKTKGLNENETDSSGKGKKRHPNELPECNPSCLDYMHPDFLSIPIDSKCNTGCKDWFEFWIEEGYLIPLILMVIILPSMIISIVRCIRRKSKSMDNESIPLTVTKKNSGMVENDLYATMKDLE